MRFIEMAKRLMETQPPRELVLTASTATMMENPSNVLYEQVVDTRVNRLLWGGIREFENLGFDVHTGSYLLHEEAIRIGQFAQNEPDDEVVRQYVRRIVKPYAR